MWREAVQFTSFLLARDREREKTINNSCSVSLYSRLNRKSKQLQTFLIRFPQSPETATVICHSSRSRHRPRCHSFLTTNLSPGVKCYGWNWIVEASDSLTRCFMSSWIDLTCGKFRTVLLAIWERNHNAATHAITHSFPMLRCVIFAPLMSRIRRPCNRFLSTLSIASNVNLLCLFACENYFTLLFRLSVAQSTRPSVTALVAVATRLELINSMQNLRGRVGAPL